jgi:soluble lytic murein transglycosylase-like protein
MAVSLNPSRAIFILVAAGLPVLAGESAILASGARMHVDRHEVSDGVVKLFSGGGVTELPASVILEFEADDPLPPVPQPPVPVPTVAAPVAAQPKDPKGLVRGAALRSGLPPAFVESVARTESAMNQHAVSPKGALGVMQLMPETARKLGADPTDLEQNIDAGTRLLRDLLVRYNGDVVKALAAYNAGEGAVDRYNGLPPYPETQNYVNKVIHGYLAQPNPVSTESTPREPHSGAAQ